MSVLGGSGWYAVRCVFEAQRGVFEERITLWRADSFERAIQRAEDEAREYAATITDSEDAYLGFAQAYRVYDTPGDGAEVFSLMRTSRRTPESYLDHFFDTGKERQQTI